MSTLSQEQIREIDLRLQSEGRTILQLSCDELQNIIVQMQLHSTTITPLSAEELNHNHFLWQSHGFDVRNITENQIQQLHAHLRQQGKTILNLSPDEVQHVINLFQCQRQTETVYGHPTAQYPHSVQSANVQASVGQGSTMLCKVVLTKSDGSAKEFLVKEQDGNQVFNLCTQVDISCGSEISGCAQFPPTALQTFPPHTLRYVDVADLEEHKRSEHSDTSYTSVGSGARSVASGGCAPTDSALTGSGSTR